MGVRPDGAFIFAAHNQPSATTFRIGIERSARKGDHCIVVAGHHRVLHVKAFGHLLGRCGGHLRRVCAACKQSRDPPQCGLLTAVESASSVNAAADCQEALCNRRIDESAAAADSDADNAAVMQPITWRLSSIPRWPTPLTVMVST